MISPTKKIIASISLLFLVLFIYFAYAVYQDGHQPIVRAFFLDVGQGDGILLRTPGGQNILIDGGPNNTVVQKMGQYLPFYDRTINLLILTHPHADHVTGLVEVLKRYKVKQILATGAIHTAPEYLNWLKLVKEKKIEFIKVTGPRDFIFSGSQPSDEVILKILYPLTDISQNSFKDLNESSIVAKLIFGQNSILLTGDLPTDQELDLLASDVDVSADILKVGHHGSKYSSSPEFLAKVKPKYGIIEVGKKNDFGHPHLRTLRNLEKASIQILRTDLLGDVGFEIGRDEVKLIKK